MDGYDLKLDFSVELENNQLMDLLEDGSAIIVYHIENSLAGFRNVYETDSLNHSIKIPIRRVKDRVEICSFIIAKKNISKYTNNSFNPDYGKGVSFDIEKGCVLAVANPFELNVPKIQEELTVAEEEKEELISLNNSYFLTFESFFNDVISSFEFFDIIVKSSKPHLNK